MKVKDIVKAVKNIREMKEAFNDPVRVPYLQKALGYNCYDDCFNTLIELEEFLLELEINRR